jgi:hypothetical protein
LSIRTAPKESPSDFLNQKRVVQDLLGDMHKDKDENDLAILNGAVKRFSESRIKNRASSANIETTYCGKDFLTPDDPIDERITGFSSGNRRSIMEFDTFGPNHSQKVKLKRSKKIVPLSPNTDRNRLLVTPDERKNFERSMNAPNAESSFISKDTRARRNHWFETYQSRITVRSPTRLWTD